MPKSPVLTFVIATCRCWRGKSRLGFVVIVKALAATIVGTNRTTSFGLTACSGHPRGGAWKPGERIIPPLNIFKKHSESATTEYHAEAARRDRKSRPMRVLVLL